MSFEAEFTTEAQKTQWRSGVDDFRRASYCRTVPKQSLRLPWAGIVIAVIAIAFTAWYGPLHLSPTTRWTTFIIAAAIMLSTIIWSRLKAR